MKLTEIKDTEEHYFEDGLGQVQGEYKSYHENGHLRSLVCYKDDILQGRYTSYHDNGQMEYSCIMADGELHGEFKRWNSSGLLRMHMLYDQGEIIAGIDAAGIDNLTNEDKVFLSLKHNIKFLS